MDVYTDEKALNCFQGKQKKRHPFKARIYLGVVVYLYSTYSVLFWICSKETRRSSGNQLLHRLCLLVFNFYLACAFTPYELLDFGLLASQIEQCAPHGRQHRHEHGNARTVRGVAPRILARRDGLGEAGRRQEK